MRFIDLSHTVEYDPEVFVPLFIKNVGHRRVKGHPDNFEWTVVVQSSIEEDQLPELPKPFMAQRAAMLDAMGGGIQVQNQLKKFARSGKISLMPLQDGEPVLEGQPASLDPCLVHFAEAGASEGKAWMRWHLTVTSDSSKAQQWVELERRDVWLKFELSPGNAQLGLFDRKVDLAVIEGGAEGESEEAPRRRTRRGGARHKASS